MAIYFTMCKSPAPALTVIFDADGRDRAIRYKQGLVSDGSYRSDQITVSGTDSKGQAVQG
jgi:hypothetical protein